jgi:hypothetical protein
MSRSFVTLALFLGACSVGAVEGAGGVDADVNDPSAQSFNAMVKPIITRLNCTVGCHAPGLLQPVPALNEYVNLQANYKVKPGNTSRLITHVGDGLPHQTTTYFTTQDKATVSAWLDSLP